MLFVSAVLFPLPAWAETSIDLDVPTNSYINLEVKDSTGNVHVSVNGDVVMTQEGTFEYSPPDSQLTNPLDDTSSSTKVTVQSEGKSNSSVTVDNQVEVTTQNETGETTNETASTSFLHSFFESVLRVFDDLTSRLTNLFS